MSDKIRISEIFGPTIQGEGPLIGKPSIFVRTAGCDYRCAWCDTLYAVLPEYHDEWTFAAPSEIMQRVNELAGGRPIMVTLSGGNPALQPLAALIALGRRDSHGFAMETQGSISQPWFRDLDWLILSPKPPSSQMTTDWEALASCLAAAEGGPRCVFKIVVFDEADYNYARDVAARFPAMPVYLQVGNPAGATSEAADIGALMRSLDWLVGKVAADRWFEATVLPQLHVLAWGNKRGV